MKFKALFAGLLMLTAQTDERPAVLAHPLEIERPPAAFVAIN